VSSTSLPFRKVHVSRSASCTKLKNATRRNTPLEKRTRTLIGMVLLFLALLFLLVLVLMVLVPEPRGSGWRIHCGVEVTESSTNIQHALVFLVFRVLFLVFRVLVGLQAHPCSLCSSPFCLCLYKKITQPGFACVRASLLCLCALISYMNMCVCVCVFLCVCVCVYCAVAQSLVTTYLHPGSNRHLHQREKRPDTGTNIQIQNKPIC
jgi:hypothetical protein